MDCKKDEENALWAEFGKLAIVCGQFMIRTSTLPGEVDEVIDDGEKYDLVRQFCKAAANLVELHNSLRKKIVDRSCHKDPWSKVLDVSECILEGLEKCGIVGASE